jgi:phosphotriesterase-related protein
VYVGHSNDTTDLDYLVGLLKKGVWLGMDRFPGGNMPGTPDWEGRSQTMAKLVAAGYANRLLLGHDWSVALTIATKERQAERERRNPDSYLFITRRVLPRLRELGVSQQALDTMMVDNPRRFFEGRR